MFTDEYEIRLQSDGRKLPDARVLQLNIFLPKSCDTDDCRNFHMGIFGQWVTHDITLMVDNFLGKNSFNKIKNYHFIMIFVIKLRMNKGHGTNLLSFFHNSQQWFLLKFHDMFFINWDILLLIIIGNTISIYSVCRR